MKRRASSSWKSLCLSIYGEGWLSSSPFVDKETCLFVKWREETMKRRFSLSQKRWRRFVSVSPLMKRDHRPYPSALMKRRISLSNEEKMSIHWTTSNNNSLNNFEGEGGKKIVSVMVWWLERGEEKNLVGRNNHFLKLKMFTHGWSY